MKLTDFKEVSENVDVRDNMEHPEWLGTFTKEEIIEILGIGGKIWIYYDKDIPVCSAFYIPSKNKSLIKHNVTYDEAITGSIGPVMVRKEYQGNGLQMQLMKKVTDYAYSIGKTHLFAKAHADNIYSVRNILKDGFTIVDEYIDERGPNLAFVK